MIWQDIGIFLVDDSLIIVKSLYGIFRGMTKVLYIFCVEDVRGNSGTYWIIFFNSELFFTEDWFNFWTFFIKNVGYLKIMGGSGPSFITGSSSKFMGEEKRRDEHAYLRSSYHSRRNTRIRFILIIIWPRNSNGLMVITILGPGNSENSTNLNSDIRTRILENVKKEKLCHVILFRR